MNNNFLPAVGIILVTAVLLFINEYTETTFIEDYALVFIIAGMFLGMGLTKWANRSKSGE